MSKGITLDEINRALKRKKSPKKKAKRKAKKRTAKKRKPRGLSEADKLRRELARERKRLHEATFGRHAVKRKRPAKKRKAKKKTAKKRKAKKKTAKKKKLSKKEFLERMAKGRAKAKRARKR